MEILNIGPLELVIIVMIMFVLLGPKEMLKTSRRMGKLVRDMMDSSLWKQVWGVTRDIRELPQKFIDDDEDLSDTVAEISNSVSSMRRGVSSQIKETTDEANKAMRMPQIDSPKRAAQDNTIAPTAADQPEDRQPVATVPYSAAEPIDLIPNEESHTNEAGNPAQESVPSTGKSQE